jgi:hypothetical protein
VQIAISDGAENAGHLVFPTRDPDRHSTTVGRWVAPIPRRRIGGACRRTWSRVILTVAAAPSSCARAAAGSPRRVRAAGAAGAVLCMARRGSSREKILDGSTVSRYSRAVPRR